MSLLTDLSHADIIGVLGSICIAVAYFGVSSGRMDGEAPRFQIMNLAGALLILYSLWHRPNLGAIIIEVLWVGIALWSLWRWRKKS